MVSDVLSGARLHGSQGGAWGIMTSGASLSTFLGEGPLFCETDEIPKQGNR